MVTVVVPFCLLSVAVTVLGFVDEAFALIVKGVTDVDALVAVIVIGDDVTTGRPVAPTFST